MTDSAGPVVACVDGSDAALRAVRWAAAVAHRRKRPLRLVHFFDDTPLRYPRWSPTGQELGELIRSRGRRVLRAARQAAVEVGPGLDPRLDARREPTAKALISESRSASLLVLGTSGLSALDRALPGSVSVALAAHAHCPVAFVRPHVAEDEPPAEGPVVLGVDDSPASDEAIRIAFEEASWRGAGLVALHAWDDTFLAAVYEEAHWALRHPDIEEHEHELLAQRLAGWQEKYPDVAVERVVRRGRAADLLLDLADRAQLIVVGSRGRGGLTGMLLGSTSQAVLSYALCPVVVARSDP